MKSSTSTWMYLLLAVILTGSIPINSAAQNSLPFTDRFTLSVYEYEGESYLNFEPDSMPGTTQLNEKCTALYNFNNYLFSNFSKADGQTWKLRALLPDTNAIRASLNATLIADTAFQRLYMRSLNREMVEPLPIDSAMKIAAHFFYLHRVDGTASFHICVGINEVLQLSRSVAHPYHAAFCYMAIWAMDDAMELLLMNVAPFRPELKKDDVTDAQIKARELETYELMANSPELRNAILEEYERKAKYLNFELIK
ncbi:MAG: hypothetical protein IPI00_02320 [Flavobacteriales bacterium]|nr:hypothetical protein [Flavobacteriales bacterium]MBK6946044.1 hypothetical protein [Flavobacteriales bacterium]MBK7239016.1 hypothetical protein [Flavobacteriales bacterium]MBK7296806.1 hypothetical protein [Flavobacteriales bacterium]MBK9536878.1 hypothetical protein [Flavobacteriales bacterium]